MSNTVLYGIPNCDTVKKARKWLDANGVPYRFHDFRADGLEAGHVEQWIGAVGWDVVINKRSTSWKQLDADARDRMDASSAVSAAIASPTLIKRPVLEHGGGVHLGFSANGYADIFS